ncbi:hypothetical protein BU26DRAFT_15833 [Trematosphaeria pertusa]|uniref:Uncharacterized protein n=1 Tax=Trematosphaeria pertusa TaxID=390896 RepID=A0A6A6J021_9PLEO|nr:uncharacterized protein BU26DRAFT_15833 [Trematosphaeria pertusa]KAF2256171.1 hypothetical protein BU26DRAFT_15833 [Trematosphaeria pertusa]
MVCLEGRCVLRGSAWVRRHLVAVPLFSSSSGILFMSVFLSLSVEIHGIPWLCANISPPYRIMPLPAFPWSASSYRLPQTLIQLPWVNTWID